MKKSRKPFQLGKTYLFFKISCTDRWYDSMTKSSESPILWEVKTDMRLSPRWEIHDSVNHYI